MIVDLNFSWKYFEKFKSIYEWKKNTQKSEKKLSSEF